MNDDVKRFMKCYRDLQKDRQRSKERLDLLWYRLEGVKGISYDKVPVTASAEAMEQARLDLLEKIEAERKEFDRCELGLQYLDSILEEMEEETRDAVVEIYINRRRYVDVAKSLYISKSGLEARINREFKRIMKRREGQM